MKLRLNKSQRTSGLSKKIFFSLGAQVELTSQEEDYVHKYKMGKEVIYSKERVNPQPNIHKSSMAQSFSAFALNINVNGGVKTYQTAV